MEPERFKSERKRLGLTQEQLAKKLQTSRSNIANWENGQNNPSIDMLFKCSDLFNCAVTYLAGYSDSRDGKEDDRPIPEYIKEESEEKFSIDDIDINEIAELFNEEKNFDELELLFNKAKPHLSDDDKETMKFLMQKTINNYEKSKNQGGE